VRPIVKHHGVVEDVGLRSTKLKSLQGTQFIVPNREIANSSIENISRRPARKVETEYGIVYSSMPDQINRAIAVIKEILQNQELVRKDYKVYFAEFRDFSLIIKAIYWCETEDLDVFVNIQTAINLKIKQAFAENKLDFAYPTQTLYLINQEKNQ
ncbi:MAG TPA: mechanosensitive ion channel, partial [bacterium]|nr:mechanosensitive ion channel [bacterium]